MKKNHIIALIAVCAAVGAAVAAIIIFRNEISDFVKKIIAKIERMRYPDDCEDCCFDDAFDDFDDFEDVCTPFCFQTHQGRGFSPRPSP